MVKTIEPTLMNDLDADARLRLGAFTAALGYRFCPGYCLLKIRPHWALPEQFRHESAVNPYFRPGQLCHNCSRIKDRHEMSFKGNSGWGSGQPRYRPQASELI